MSFIVILNFNVYYYDSGSVEAGQLYLPRRRSLLLSLQGCYLEPELSMVTYNKHNVRWAITWIVV